jgi:esterase/lipase
MVILNITGGIVMKVMKYVNLAVFVLLISSCSTYRMLTISKNTKPLNKQYPNMNTLVYGNSRAYEFKNNNSDKLIINIEGSGWYSVLGYTNNNKIQKGGWWYFVVEEFKNEFTILVPEKLTFELGKFYYYDTDVKKEYTLENYSVTINNYLSENNYSQIILVGSSEGACILPLVYKNIINNNKISCMVSVSYGGLSRCEQIKILANSQLNISDMTRNVFQNIEEYKKDIELYSNSIGDFAGFSYTHWSSFFDYKPFDEYKGIYIPVLFIHGEQDVNVPVESARYIQNNLPNKPFEYLYYGDADHNSFRNSIKTMKDLENRARTWLY